MDNHALSEEKIEEAVQALRQAYELERQT